MRHKTLFSLLVLCGSTAALAHMAPVQTAPPLQNEMTNEGAPAPAPDDMTANDTLSNATDVEPGSEPTDSTDNGSDTAPVPNATHY